MSCCLPDASSAFSAGSAPVGPSVSTPLASGFCSTAVRILFCASVGSLRLTETTSTGPPSPCSKPSHLWSSATLPTSWLTQSALVTPASAIRSPAPSPAMSSVCPTCVSAPSSSLTSPPELSVTTGMSASIAPWIESSRASASGTEMARPSGSEATAASISWLILTMSKVSGALYLTSTPMSSAAWSTPFLTTDQNGSDACPCVTTAMVISLRSEDAPPPSSPPCSPPHPAMTTSAKSTAASDATQILDLPTTLLLSRESSNPAKISTPAGYAHVP